MERLVRIDREIEPGIYVAIIDYGEGIGEGETALCMTPHGAEEAVNTHTDDNGKIIHAWSWVDYGYDDIEVEAAIDAFKALQA